MASQAHSVRGISEKTSPQPVVIALCCAAIIVALVGGVGMPDKLVLPYRPNAASMADNRFRAAPFAFDGLGEPAAVHILVRTDGSDMALSTWRVSSDQRTLLAA